MLKINIKKVLFYTLLVIVTILVITALYSNRYKFNGVNIIKYVKVNIENETNLNELADKYSSGKTKIKFVSEIKRINNINSPDYIPGNSTLIIPIIESK